MTTGTTGDDTVRKSEGKAVGKAVGKAAGEAGACGRANGDNFSQR